MLLLVTLIVWSLRPTDRVMRLLGPGTTRGAARIIVIAFLIVGPGVMLIALSLGVRAWIALPMGCVAIGLCCTQADSERSRFAEIAALEMTELLDLFSRSLKVGMSLEQVIDTVSRSGQGPVAQAFARCRHAAALGRDVPTVLAEQAALLGVRDLSALAALVGLHRETGGGLADRLAAQMVSISRRRHLDSKLRMAAMQVTLQADILVVFLAILLAQTAVIEPRNIEFLLHQDLGRQMLAGAITLAAGGWFAIWGLLRLAIR